MMTIVVKGIKNSILYNMLWFWDNSEAKNGLNKVAFLPFKIEKIQII
jgi:hypothetical protein